LKDWNKKVVTKAEIEPLCKKYNINGILASIFVRRGITSGEKILFFLEKDLRFQHNPFLFNNMEDAVDRILAAKEDEEKILIFGDKDVDGVSSTAIIFEYLKRINADVQWRLPVGDDSYGLSIQAIDDFYEEGGTLIITVDCGISNNYEIDYANEKGIDVIVTDHHNPTETLPNAVSIINPKIDNSGYPFKDISGAAVISKVVSALRFSQTPFYKTDICLIDIQESNNCYEISCLKIRNMKKYKELKVSIVPGQTSISETKLPFFLEGQIIYAWDSIKTSNQLTDLFGKGIMFELIDFKKEVSKVYPSLQNKSINDLSSISKSGLYSETTSSLLDNFYNLFVSYLKRIEYKINPSFIEDEIADIQLVALAALADIMPMKDENRVFVNSGISSIKENHARKGLAELLSKMNITKDSINSTTLAWTIIPSLNAAGRLGQSNLSLELLISEDSKKREELAETIFQLNEKRKKLVSEAEFSASKKAQDSLEKYENKLSVIIDNNIHRGITGIVATKFMQNFNVPSIVITSSDDNCIGSMRSCRGFIATEFLSNFSDILTSFGGHDYAAGFNFKANQLENFITKLNSLVPSISMNSSEDIINIDAEIPEQYLEPSVFNILDTFEPYGNENEKLCFLSCKLKLISAELFGKKNPMHLKLIFDCGKYKIPAIYWNSGDRLNNDIAINEKYDIIYELNKKYYNGLTTNQLEVINMVKSES
jgi:single-stranded-DNA-specific exonuclease